MQGVSGENLLRLMELRMDNVVFRMGFGTSRPQARQLVVHGHFLLNGRKHNIPSAILKPGDVITVREKDRKSTRLNSSHANISYAVFCLKKKLNSSQANFSYALFCL